MELTQLIQFKTVAEYESVSKAAQNLHISPPALSKSVHKLEEELGVTLLDRTKNTVALNQAGKLVMEHVNLVLTILNKMQQELSELSQSDREITIGSPLPASIRYFLPLFNMSRPDIITRSHVIGLEQLKNDLLKRKIDVAILPEPFHSPLVSNICFGEERLMMHVPVSSPLAVKKSLTIHDLDKQRVVKDQVYSENTFNERVEKLARQKNIDIYYLDEKDYYVYRELMKSSNYLYFGSNIAMKYTDRLTSRIYIPFSEPELRITYYISYLNDNHKRVEPFLEWIRRNYEKLLG